MGALKSLDAGALWCSLSEIPLEGNGYQQPPPRRVRPPTVRFAEPEASESTCEPGKHCGALDAGALSCQLETQRLDSCFHPEPSHGSSHPGDTGRPPHPEIERHCLDLTLVSPNDPLSDGLSHGLCGPPRSNGDFVVDRPTGILCLSKRNEYFAPCFMCGDAPASVVEVACGHVGICSWCNRGPTAVLQSRCVVCGKQSSDRFDIFRSLYPATGQPRECFICKQRLAEVLALPCGCFAHCKNCFKASQRGCHSCGETLESHKIVSWMGPDFFFGETAAAFQH